MKPLEEHFAEYAAHHRSPLNKLTHAVGIPLIGLSLLGMASELTFGTLSGHMEINLGTLLILVLVAIYMQWHRGLALLVLLLSFPLYAIGSSLGFWRCLALLAAGVALQYVGHFVFERRKPAFHDNLVHTLIGPLWMTSLLLPRKRRPGTSFMG
jgi:uncharacterized membrane protein YGL010W